MFRLGQVRHRAGVFDEFLQGSHHFRPREKLAENVYLVLQLFAGNRLHKLLRGSTRHRIVLSYLGGCGACNPQGLALSGKLRYKADSVGASSVECATREQHISHDGISQVPLQAWNSSKAWNEPKPQLRKSKTRHLIRNDDVASECKLESSAQARTMNGGDRNEWSRIQRVHDAVNAFQKTANSLRALFFRNRDGLLIQFAQVAACRKNR